MERRAKPAEEMIGELEQEKQGKLYKGGNKPTYSEVSAELKQEAISAAVRQQRELLATTWKRGKADLHDVDVLRAQADQYLLACERTGTIPTLLGLACSVGVSRNRLYQYCQQFPESDSAKFIENFRTASAAVIAQGALTRALDNSTSIFLLKNSGQNLADRHDLEVNTQPADPFRYQMTAEEIAKFYAELPED